MFERREEMRKWFYDVVEKFRQKGAVSPEKAMTAEELNLPPRFEVAMKRRLGRSGVFVEVDGKYYLSEERLKQIEDKGFAERTGSTPRRNMFTLRIVQMVMIILFFSIFLASILVNSSPLRILSILFLVVWLAISVAHIYFLSRFRKRRLQGPDDTNFNACYLGKLKAYRSSLLHQQA